jgi:2,4-dienoyl-CoA reductase-like NADH-dependent reductase (Old Yellow Enzyme family)
MLYEQWCSTGVGICFTDHMYIDRFYMETPGDIVVDEKSSLSELQKLAEISTDSLIIPRISHPGLLLPSKSFKDTKYSHFFLLGRMCPRFISKAPVSSSSLAPVHSLLTCYSRGLQLSEIPTIISQYNKAAAILHDSGFQGSLVRLSSF